MGKPMDNDIHGGVSTSFLVALLVNPRVIDMVIVVIHC